MSDSNLTQVIYGKEVGGWGVSPAAGAGNYKKVRFTGESMTAARTFSASTEIRDDRMTVDTIMTGATASGDLNFELSHGGFDDFIEGALMDAWSLTPVDVGTAITDVDGLTEDAFAVDSVAGYAAGQLIKTTGFTNTENDGIFTIDAIVSLTLETSDGTALVDETPPATARLKVVGFAGVADDITATATGLGSTALDFTTLGLTPGQWIKIGGTAAGDRFDTEALNDWARISLITTNALTLTELPVGTDAGAGKTIKVWFGDTLQNGVTEFPFTIEKGYLGMDDDSYHLFNGMVVNSMSLTLGTESIITGSFNFMGKDGVLGGDSIETGDLVEAATNDVLNTLADVGSINEAGSPLNGTNCVTGLDFTIGNNLRTKKCIGSLAAADIGVGSLDITGTLTPYFGDRTLMEKFIAGTETSISNRITKDGQAIIFTFPRVKYESGTANISGQNADIMTPLTFRALRDVALSAQVMISSVEYYEV